MAKMIAPSTPAAMKSLALAQLLREREHLLAEHRQGRHGRGEKGVPARQRQGGGADEHHQQAADAAGDAAAGVQQHRDGDNVGGQQQRHAVGPRNRVALLVRGSGPRRAPHRQRPSIGNTPGERSPSSECVVGGERRPPAASGPRAARKMPTSRTHASGCIRGDGARRLAHRRPELRRNGLFRDSHDVVVNECGLCRITASTSVTSVAVRVPGLAFGHFAARPRVLYDWLNAKARKPDPAPRYRV